ncbi:JmjC domain-containing histone demethylation protein 1 [Penicillium canariense]|uniref:JmjC domain-containing histone demethylation protein 1 n=1 Tax=Penicillium canariense TaxID=189055 RepID=A0A9W9LCP7_9EURO|nr:JmjC domain-containing histone demethylation protein 1 [Penicillium canariense]KAJ5150921.1 JmjC domain-containing histone demethylation protein 1 [Penicillium canariense]
MMSAASFMIPLGERPPQYRTPSPPRRAVEPITPSTAEFRASWAERGIARAASLDRDQRPSNHARSALADGGSHHRSGHGRSNSTIDTLATIALATSPTLAPLPPCPSSPNSRSTVPLFTSELTTAERPAKRPRSERDPSPYHSSSSSRAMPLANSPHPSMLDSMKTDAELLLNFARPANIHPAGHHTKRVSIDESFHHHHHYGGDAVRHNRFGVSNGGYGGGRADTKLEYHHPEDHVPPSRMRSRSDGSAFISRPVIRGMRPTTSAGTLPPIAWEEDNEDSASPTEMSRYAGYGEYSSSGPQQVPFGSQTTMGVTPKVEEEDGSDTNQASCAACHMVRIPVETEEQEEDTWIGCDGCKRWFHIVCAGFKNDREVRTVDKFICRNCRSVHGQTTFVRKSSRARTAIDYAGLNQGLVKAASDSKEHHYLEPIRQGKIRFLPESFPRMKPELVNAEYFERGNGWTEPVVIPACWNTHDPVPEVDSDFESLVQDASSQEMFDDLLEHLEEHKRHVEETIDCGQDQLDMVIPQGLTVRAVAELYGPEERVEVIDVKSQQGEDKRWDMQKWADYYESNEPNKPVRNVISLEVSQSRLGRLIKRPKVVRDLDLQDAVWPDELKAIGEYPKVQFYCLMSVADCYTDFHIDFGGSSVYYHILKGKKTFFFIPPKDKHLKKYEEWCNSPAQDSIFLGNQTKECYRVDLSEGDTMLIPSGWIHAVWTPENSLVIGGNFLTRLNYGMQIKVLNIEKDTKVPKKFRYPFFQKIQWYTALRYLGDDPLPQNVLAAFAQDENYQFHRHCPIYYEFGELANKEPAGSPYFNARFYSQAELEGLPELTKYLLRTALIASSYTVDGVTMEVRNAVRRSIPKGIGDPVDMIRRFGIWVAWKRGNEKAPQWTHPGVIESNPKVSLTEKKSAGRPSRRSERSVDSQRTYAERQAVQRPSDELVATPIPQVNNLPYLPSESATPAPAAFLPEFIGRETSSTSKPRYAPRGSGLGPKRVACDACRRRRIRCRHKDEPSDLSMMGGQMAGNGFGSGSGLSTPSSLAQDAVSALNSLAAIASQAGFQNNGVVGFDPFEGSGTFHSAIMGASTAAANRLNEISPDGTNGGKKGRSKACDDCRKSKRRCIHDEYGRVDPIKAQERSKPRGTASSKRPRPNEDDNAPVAAKKTKQESTSPITHPMSFEGYPATAMVPQSVPSAAFDHGAAAYDAESHQAEPNKVAEVTVGQALYASPPVFHADSVEMKDANSVSVSSKPTVSLVSPPTSLADEMDVVHDGEAMASVEGEAPPALHTPNSSSRHSSRQPRHVERFVPEATAARASKPAGRAMSSTARRTTPGPPSSSKKPSSRPSSSHAKKSSPMVERHFERPAATSLSPHQSKHAKHRVEEDADAESLRLIRELQEEEFGLRRRRG